MSKRTGSGRPALAMILLWLLISLACNYPTASRKPRGLAAEYIRQTLAAQGFPTPPELTTVPNSTQPPLASPFVGLSTAAPGQPGPGALETPVPGTQIQPILYFAQPGDTLPALTSRFAVTPEQITSPQPILQEALLTPGQPLSIPNMLGEVQPASALLPDSEVIDSPSAAGFDERAYADQAGGYLSTYHEKVDDEQLSGSEIVRRVAIETSTNPRVLLAVLEYRSHWVTGQPESPERITYPIGFYVPGYQGLYKELSLTAKELNIGYYGWRSGTVLELKFPDKSTRRLSPELNAGSVALQYLFSKLYKPGPWLETLYGSDNFLLFYRQMFGDPWDRAAQFEPLLPGDLSQPALELPFSQGERWSLTAGPHTSWTTGTPPGAIDLAPVTGEPACVVSRAWITASAPGIVTRSDHNVVVIDLDGDGYEQTGWEVFYLHVADRDRVSAGTHVGQDERIGHPSCEGGRTTGTHVHVARKYNGEWISADGPLPFVLSGWEVKNGTKLYEGYLVKDEQVVTAHPDGSHGSIIVR